MAAFTFAAPVFEEEAGGGWLLLLVLTEDNCTEWEQTC
eukprot:SAG25_NODE_443_length_7964_cov_171.205722_2_plen_38_part_00